MVKKEVAFKQTRGRPPQLTEELIKKICNAIKGGNYVDTACRMYGVSREVFAVWAKLGNGKKVKGHKPNELHQEFVRSLDEAVNIAEARDVLVIEQAANGRPAEYDSDGNLIRAEIPPNFKAAAWRLERKHSEHWGRRDAVKVFEAKEDEEFKPEDSHEKLLRLIEECDD